MLFLRGQRDESALGNATSATSGTSGLILNEVLANEPGSATSGEMIEIVNTTSQAINLAGYTLSDAVQIRHTYASTMLCGGCAMAVFGGAASLPAGLTNAVASSTGTLSLGNGGDTVTLRDGSGATLDTVTYTAAFASVDGVSFNRTTDGTASPTWSLHTALSSLHSSPGKRVDGSDFLPIIVDAGSPDSGSSDAGPFSDGSPGTDSGPSSDSGPGTDSGPASDGGSSETGAIRIMAGNLTSGNLQSYDPGDGIHIFQALKPDIAMIQEFNYGADDDASIRTFIDTAFGTSYNYVRQSGVQIPNGVVTHYPILASGVWTDPEVANRAFTWARIDIPGPHDIWAVSVHLLTSNGTSRMAQANALVGYLQSNVPAGDYVTVGGDFNSSDPNLISIFSPFIDPTAAFPDDQNGNVATNQERKNHYDWVLVSQALESFQTQTQVGSVVRPHGLVFDTRVFTPLSDAPPALVTDSAASNMQHMGVIKDFFIH